FCHSWPMKIWFYCALPAERGGETPIVDSRKVFRLMDPAIKRQFVEKNIMYVRSYGSGAGLTWQEVFQTDSKSEVEEHCKKAEIEFEWRGDDLLRTRTVRMAVARHPKTNDPVWQVIAPPFKFYLGF